MGYRVGDGTGVNVVTPSGRKNAGAGIVFEAEDGVDVLTGVSLGCGGPDEQ
jgi:hypothetical protein